MKNIIFLTENYVNLNVLSQAKMTYDKIIIKEFKFI